jgi:hypothetical protein
MWQEMPREMQAVRKRLACTSAEGLLRSATRFGVAGGVPTCETPPDEFDGTFFSLFHLAIEGWRWRKAPGEGKALAGLGYEGVGSVECCDGLRWSYMRRGMSSRWRDGPLGRKRKWDQVDDLLALEEGKVARIEGVQMMQRTADFLQ